MEQERIKKIKNIIAIEPKDIKTGDRLAFLMMNGEFLVFDIVSTCFRNLMNFTNQNDPNQYIGFVGKLYICRGDAPNSLKKQLNKERDYRIARNPQIKIYSFQEFLELHHEIAICKRQERLNIYAGFKYI